MCSRWCSGTQRTICDKRSQSIDRNSATCSSVASASHDRNWYCVFTLPAQTDIQWHMGNDKVLLQIPCWIKEWENFESQLTLAKVMHECRVASYYSTHSVYNVLLVFNSRPLLIVSVDISSSNLSSFESTTSSVTMSALEAFVECTL